MHKLIMFYSVVGGRGVVTNMVSKTLANFDDNMRKWCHKFPPMLTGRFASSASANDDYLFVVGGTTQNSEVYLDVVEVLDLETMKWAKASPVPKPVTFMSIATCSITNRIYHLGGYVISSDIHEVQIVCVLGCGRGCGCVHLSAVCSVTCTCTCII